MCWCWRDHSNPLRRLWDWLFGPGDFGGAFWFVVGSLVGLILFILALVAVVLW